MFEVRPALRYTPTLFALAAVVLVAAARPAVTAEPQGTAASATERVTLKSSWQPGQTTHVEVMLEVAGDLSLVEKDKVAKLPLSVDAKLVYDEKLVSGSPDNLPTVRALRHYSQAGADIKIEKGHLQPELRAERRLIGAMLSRDRATLFSPDGSLLREEIDLVDVQANSLALEALLPTEPVASGDRWSHPRDLVVLLLGLEAVSTSDVESLLASVDETSANFELSGTVHGAVHGVAAEIEIRAKCKFDRQLNRITWFAMAVKERRSIGHVDPGIDVVAKLQVKLTPGVVSEQLDPAALKLTNQSWTNVDTSLGYESLGGNYALHYDRRWYIMHDEGRSVVMRYVDRGELIAQCNVSTPTAGGVDTIPTLEKFQQDIQQNLGEHFGQFLRASEGHDDLGRRILRVDAVGKASELPIQWNYVHLSDETGNQAVLLFTVEQGLVERFGDAPRRLSDNLRFLGAYNAPKPQPTPAAAPAPAEAQ